ncbi:hypothetical protein EV361DRAFT_931626 [Lentinula raphanica]|uniref:Uncharacterized protein n=1 Tax=Lentinula raphanica TaxID=153919 RepID=A0AA38PJC6_9AGAR|nr:hypothetical protein F5878DRAFT_603137 [Lentinula raphanica]KAJ3967234.1 hypothetical protein EV361DRAFT_931626 [Lentinula raphanica]
MQVSLLLCLALESITAPRAAEVREVNSTKSPSRDVKLMILTSGNNENFESCLSAVVGWVVGWLAGRGLEVSTL